MQVPDFTYLLQQPGKLETPVQTRQLEEVLQAYPWFQAARALHLKGLRNLNSYKYNQALKATAACTADREVLFDFITSEAFLQNDIADAISGKVSLSDREIVSEEVAPGEARERELIEEEPDGALPRSAADADQILDPGLFRSVDPEVDKKIASEQENAREKLGMGKPLDFNRGERYSFSEWLQITSFGPGAAPAGAPESHPAGQPEKSTPARDARRKKKFERIDRFIEENPRIVPQKAAGASKVNIKESLKLDKEELMTETLARVYLEQGKYKKAIQSYRILSLKYPEKSGFFADQIKAVEKLQQDKPKK
ncbi:hypothetical protein [Robiginitalea sp. SC105]|uniref:hypothetical protein n=1 Tax=Robiginitalea sp. SC105 TaxID=2762332 RepID=UPI00163AC51E|nr:hypothetical protein [Robiginitalea sp. SC105]MBC2837779.1 hypothetical protein [Robiginitalea sp. SC105]